MTGGRQYISLSPCGLFKPILVQGLGLTYQLGDDNSNEMSTLLRQSYNVYGRDPRTSQETPLHQLHIVLETQSKPDSNILPPLIEIKQHKSLMIQPTLTTKPLPPIPYSPSSESLPPAYFPLPDSPTVNLQPLSPPVPLKLKPKAIRYDQAPGCSPPSKPLRPTARNFSIPWLKPLSPASEAKTNLPTERPIHDIRASIWATILNLQAVAASTARDAKIDSMCGTLQRLNRRMLNGRHRKLVQEGDSGRRHWAELETELTQIQQRCYEVDIKAKIDLRGVRRRNEMVGLLNAWEWELRLSWTDEVVTEAM
jgi:hypothetical protein